MLVFSIFTRLCAGWRDSVWVNIIIYSSAAVLCLFLFKTFFISKLWWKVGSTLSWPSLPPSGSPSGPPFLAPWLPLVFHWFSEEEEIDGYLAGLNEIIQIAFACQPLPKVLIDFCGFVIHNINILTIRTPPIAWWLNYKIRQIPRKQELISLVALNLIWTKDIWLAVSLLPIS